jgi:hypothetical protein
MAPDSIDRIEGSSRRAAFPALALILAFAAVHLWLALKFPLAPDETYYWEWSRRPAWGYYDQGPMIAWWIRGGCLIFGESELGIRAPIILAFALTQGFLYFIARDLINQRAALVSVFVAGISPMALAGGFLATYDPLVILFWTAALYFAARAVIFGNRASWLGLGIAFGLGLLCKHTMALFAPCLLAFLLTSKHRAILGRPEPYLALALGLLLFVPNLIWQDRHDWMTFGHLFNLTGKGTDHGFVRRLGDFVGSQVFLISPLLFFGFLAALVWVYRKRTDSDLLGLLFWCSAPVLLFFFVMTAKSKVQANWAITGWVTPPILFAAWLQYGSRASRAFGRAGIVFCCILSALLVLPESRAQLGIRIPVKWDQMNKLYGGRELATNLHREKLEMERETGSSVKLGSTTYDSTSRISFYSPGRPQACNLFLGTRPNSYLLWHEDNCPEPGDNMILTDDHAPGQEGRPPFEAVFERVVPAERGVPIYRTGVYYDPVRTYYLYRCYNYRPNLLVERPSGPASP